MPINYLTLKRQAALRLSQLIGSSQADLETAYTEPVFADMLDGSEIPATAFKDAILSIERELVQFVGNNAGHPARSFLYGASATLSDLSSTPTEDVSGKQYFGVFDSCSDADNNRPCTWQPTQTITDIVDLGADFFGDTAFYYFNITGNFIRTTRPSVILQGVSWSYTDQASAYDSDSDSPLPEGLEAAWLDGVTARAAQVGWVAGDLFNYFSNQYQTGRANFNTLGGMPNMPLSAANPVSG